MIPQDTTQQNNTWQTNQDRARLVYDANVIMVRQQLLAVATVLFTVPKQSTYIMKNFTVFNTDGSTHTATIRLVPAGGVITDDQYTYWEMPISSRARDGSDPYEEVLVAGYQIVGFATSANKMNIRINGAVLVSQ